jgi:hypothetical protein
VPRTWNVSVAGLSELVPVSSRRMRRYAKILIFRIGDWETEQLMLNPLAESLKAQLSLLVPPNEIDVEYIRTLDELADALSVHGGGAKPLAARQSSPWGYAIFVGHGRTATNPGIRFGRRWHSPTSVAGAIKNLGPGGRSFSDAVFVSLCCETGEPGFADTFSDALNTTFVGPGAIVHSFEAAGLVHRLFYELFLSGATFAQALRRTHTATADYKTHLRCWLDGTEA